MILKTVTGHLSEGSSVRNVVVQIPKFDAKRKPNPNSNPNPSPSPNPINFGQMTLPTNDPLKTIQKQHYKSFKMLMLPVGKILTDLAATGTELNMHQHRWCYLHKNTHTHALF